MIETHHLNAQDDNAIVAAANWLRQGRLVAFPTDTVYGVGVAAFNAAAIEKLYQAKRRPFAKGIPILLADLADLDKVARDVSPLARQYITQFWPGPLTLIVARHPDLPPIISPNDGIAVRLPDCDTARALIRATGGAVAATSANRSGDEPAQSGVEAMAKLEGWVTAVLDNGSAPGGRPSTIIDCTGAAPRLLRKGPIIIPELTLAGEWA